MLARLLAPLLAHLLEAHVGCETLEGSKQLQYLRARQMQGWTTLRLWS